MGEGDEKGDYSIKPENVTPTISTADWPLLLKNYEKRMESMNYFSYFC